MKKNILFYLLYINSFCVFAQDQFTNNGNFKIHSGATMSVFGSFINNGAFVDSGSVLTLAGTIVQQIGGSVVTTFKNLTLNNSAGCYLSKNESIVGELNIQSGTFSSTGFNFTLLSNINGTARIAPILGDFSGNITMQRYLGVGPTSWRFLASPVLSVTISNWQDDFVTSGFPGSNFPNNSFVSVYTYDETVLGSNSFGYKAATNASNPIVPGKGYWCYIGPVPLTIDLTGPPVKFNHTFDVSYTASAGPSEDGFVMIGNPYPSPIDWSSAAWTKTHINDAVYIWNPALQQYASWVSGVSTNGGSNFIASSQSFWVQTNAANPVLSSTENCKTTASPNFLRSSNSFDKLKLTLSGNNRKDETILRFGDGATNNYDSDLDARKIFSTNTQVPSISTLDSASKDMSISSLPPVSSVTHIPVKTLVGVSGNYSISIDSTSATLAEYCIVLEDLLTGTQTNLSTTYIYTFSISNTTQNTRFILHVTAPHKVGALQPTCSNLTNGKAVALAKGIGPWNYTWYNNTNTVIKQTLNTFEADTITNLSAGNYSVQINAINSLCGLYTKNVSITSFAAIHASFQFINDTITAGETDSIVLQNTSIGAATYEWNFGDGSSIDTMKNPSTHHYTTEGKYNITLVVRSQFCSDTLTKQVIVVKPNDMVNNVLNEFMNEVTVYPNPGNGIFYINMRSTKYTNASIHIFSATGQSLLNTKLLTDKTKIDLTHCAKGIYFYQIINEENAIYHGKLIIE